MRLFTPAYKDCGERMAHLTPFQRNRVFMMALEHAYKVEIENQVLNDMLGTRDLDNVSKKKIRQIMRKEEFQLNCLDKVVQILANQRTIESAQSSAKIFISTAILIAPSLKPPDDLVPEVEDDF